MGLGEYLATKSQNEAWVGEMNLEKIHYRHHKDVEVQEVKEQMQKWGLKDPVLTQTVSMICETEDSMMSFMKVFEFGLNDDDIRQPWKAMLVSFFLFVAGSLPSVLPFAIMNNVKDATFLSCALAGLSLFVVGAMKAYATRGSWVKGGLENLFLCAVGAAISFGIGYSYGDGVDF
eukprot:c40928_g1_i1.p1 GENE.c40928_g1_i1~~c40928_g1_i1.p1  ORF type:complete len:175 (-),score=7.73 c40928_g1_i1:20-544(-)